MPVTSERYLLIGDSERNSQKIHKPEETCVSSGLCHAMAGIIR